MSRKKDAERKCLDMILSDKNVSTKFGKEINDKLASMKDSIIDAESPDFIFQNEKEVIGLEHFMVDTTTISGNDSAIMRNKGVYREIVDKYKKDSSIENGIRGLEKGMTQYFNSIRNFDYKEFIDRFDRICSEHNDKAEGYRDRIKGKYNKNVKLGCIIEIPSQMNEYIVTDERYISSRQNINGVPLTVNMLMKIYKMQNFDFVIINTYYAEVGEYIDTKGVKIYYIDIHRDASYGLRGIGKIYSRFEYDTSKLAEGIRIKDTDDGITIRYTYSK